MDDREHVVVWRLRLSASPGRVFELLSTDEGRASFWVESSEQRGEEITMRFPDGSALDCRVIDCVPPNIFALTYFEGAVVTFELRETGGGTDLTLRETSRSEQSIAEDRAGWVSVLMNLKAQADHAIDLRNHDPSRTWADGFVDN